MRTLLRLVPTALVVLAGCDSGGEQVVAGRVASGVGPAGAELKGPAGTQLEGLVLRIPAGALDQLVQVSVTPGSGVELPATQNAAVPVRVTATPDPGLLLLPLTVTLKARLLDGFTEQSLVALQRVSLPGPEGGPEIVRVGVAAPGGVVDGRRGTFTFAMSRLCDFEVRRAVRRPGDAATLLALATDAFQPITPEATRRAGFLCAQALAADPLAGDALVYEAAARLLTLLVDDADVTPDIDSVGEALRRLGVDLGNVPLLERLLTLDASGITVELPGDAPNLAALAAFAERVLRPELVRTLDQLARVPDDFQARLVLPARFAPVPREIDRADVAAFRAATALLLGVLDMARGVDLDFELSQLASGVGLTWSVEDVLARFPGLLVLRRDTFPGAGPAVAEGLALADEAWRALGHERDAQDDDVLRIPVTWGSAQRELLGPQLRAFWDALVAKGAQPLRQAGIPGSVQLDLKPLFRPLLVSPRALVPAFVRWVPTGELPDATCAGVFPLLTAGEATLRAGLANRFAPPDLVITIDGDPSDWPAAAEALLPRDPAGDLKDSSGVAAIDCRGLWLTRTQDHLYARIDVADGPILPRSGIVARLAVVLREVLPRGLGPQVELEVLIESPARSRLLVDGQVQPTATTSGAFLGGTAELSVALADLAPFLTAGAPWLFCVSTRARDTVLNLDSSDVSRPVVVR
jgi:hypothetical protein